eukprot:5950144-Amphidinium_carterae.1
MKSGRTLSGEGVGSGAVCGHVRISVCIAGAAGDLLRRRSSHLHTLNTCWLHHPRNQSAVGNHSRQHTPLFNK